MGCIYLVDFDKLNEYQRFLRKAVIKEDKLDRKIELMTIINQLTAGPKNLVQKEQIVIEATMQGFSEKEIDALIEQLKSDNIIFESTPGYIKKRE